MDPSLLPVTLVDYRVGNLHSIAKAIEGAGARVTVTDRPEDLLAARCLVFPGVGAFDAVMEQLAPVREGLVRRLREGVPCLAVCIGMQILYERSEEGNATGLGLLPGAVRRLRHDKLPHMGWNDVRHEGDSLFAGIPSGSFFYFVHSFAPEPGAGTIARTEYGAPFAAAVAVGNTVGTQFHPEKSSAAGRQVIRNFIDRARRQAT
jgi:glutamine amidotransferase